MKALVTGGRGMLATRLQAEIPAGWSLICMSRSHLDICHREAIADAIQTVQPDVLINCAAYTQVDRAEDDVEAAMRANGTGPAILAEACSDADLPLVHISTDFVFDGHKNAPYLESDATHPLSVYGHTKRVGEEAIRRLTDKHLIVRTAWLYDDEPPGFPHLLIRLSQNGQLRVVTDQIGSPTYAPHLAQGLFQAIQSKARGTLHLAGTGQTTRWMWANKLVELAGIQVPVHEARSTDFPTAAQRPASSSLSSAHPCGIQLPSWEEGLRCFVEQLA